MADLGLQFDILAKDSASETLSNIGTKVGDLGKKLGGLAKVAGGAAVAGGLAAFGAGIVEAIDQEAISDKLAAQLGLTAEQSASYGKIAGDLYAGAYGDSFAGVNDAISAVASSFKGIGEQDLKGATANALDLAQAFDLDVTRAAQVAGQAVTTGLAKNATDAFNKLTVTLQKVPAAIREDVLDASDEYGQFFASLGFNGEQAFGLLADAAAKGSFGIDKIGDAIKESTLLLTDIGSTGVQDAYKAIGLSARASSDAILQGGPAAQQTYQKIVKGLQSIKSPSDQATAAIALFGTPLEDLNKAEIPQFLTALQSAGKSLGATGGAAEDLGATLADNASTNITSFKRQITQTFVEILGKQVIPKLRDFSSFLSTNVGPALQRLGGFIQGAVMPALQRLGGFTSTHVVPVLQRMGGFIQNTLLPGVVRLGRYIADQFVPVFQKVVTSFRANVIPALKTLRDRIVENKGNFLLIGKVVAAAGLIFIAFQAKLVGFVIPAVFKVIGVVTKLSAPIYRVGQEVIRAGQDIARFVQGAGGHLSNFLGDVRRFLGPVVEKIRGIIGAASEAGEVIAGFVAGAAGSLSGFLGSAQRFIQPVIDLIQGIINKAQGAIDKVQSLVTLGGNLVLPGQGTSLDEIKRIGREARDAGPVDTRDRNGRANLRGTSVVAELRRQTEAIERQTAALYGLGPTARTSARTRLAGVYT